jgi:predicted metal-dependent hydrolase
MDSITINQREVPFIMRRSLKARSLRLQIVLDDPKIILTAPRFAMNFEITRFLKNRLPWIEKQWSKIEKQTRLRPTPKHMSGDTYYYFGEPVTLIIDPSSKKRPEIKIRDDKMKISIYKNATRSESVKAIKKTIEKFYKKKAEEVVHDRLEHFNEHYGFTYRRVTMRNQKSRWGSCSRDKNLNFNWRLIMAPIEVIDYVVVHEMCHLGQMNHSKNFWNLVAETIPDYKVFRKWLRENQYLLKI